MHHAFLPLGGLATARAPFGRPTPARRFLRLSLALIVSIGLASAASGQQVVGLFQNDAESYPGYTMFAKDNTVYLIDNAGIVVHTWTQSNTGTHPGYLRDDGTLVTYAGSTVEVLDWDSNVIWSWNEALMHHDIVPLPNGNVLVVYRSDYSNAEAIAEGRDPATLADALQPLHIKEIAQPGTVVWEWDALDHVVQDYDNGKPNFGVVADHPELIDLNYHYDTTSNWHHTNAISYNADLDQIIVSPRRFSELWVIDHSTTTGQAAGHTGGNSGMGGDILYRWGNPVTYGAGTVGDQQLFGQHNTQWIEPGLPGAGNMLMFNNGTAGFGGPNYSTIVEIVPPVNGSNYDLTPSTAYDPTAPVWSYEGSPQTSFYSRYISGVQRMPNGNTLIDQGADGTVFEVTDAGDIVWKYVNPARTGGILNWDEAPATQGPGFTNNLFRATRYPLDHPAFAGKDLTPTAAIETYDAYADLTLQSGPGGSVEREGTLSHGDGQLITLQATPDVGQVFDGWVVTVGSAVIADSSVAHTTFVMSASDLTIAATFAEDLYLVPALPAWGPWVMATLLLTAATLAIRSRAPAVQRTR